MTPPISLLMYDGPGRALGQVAFPAVSLLFGCVAPAFFRDLRRVTGAAHPGLVATSAAAFAGLAVVGAVPLQRDVPAVMRGEARIGADSVLSLPLGFFFSSVSSFLGPFISLLSFSFRISIFVSIPLLLGFLSCLSLCVVSFLCCFFAIFLAIFLFIFPRLPMSVCCR